MERAGKNLGLIEPGEALSAEDSDTLDGLVDPLLSQLAADGIVYVGDTEAIELEYFMPLARLLANMAGPDFGSPINDAAKQEDERLLRRLTATKASSEPVKAEYF